MPRILWSLPPQQCYHRHRVTVSSFYMVLGGVELRSSCLLEMTEPYPLPQKASFKISCTNKVLCRQTIKIKSTVLPVISLYLLRGWQHNSLRKFCMRASVFADWSTRCEISGNLSRFSPYIRLPQLNLKFRLGSPLSEQSMSRD